MIFITLGSQKFQFNRLLKAVDEQIESGKIEDVVFAQIGVSDYKPKNYEYKDFMDREEFAKHIKDADIVITHGGTGAIIGAVKNGKKVIAVPRLSKYGEHVDDHQLQLIKEFKDLELISDCLECDEIWKKIEEVKNTEQKGYISNTETMIKSIDEYIENSFRNE